MALELEGTLKQKLAVQSGSSARGAWTKQEFILEYQDGNFPAQLCLSAFGQDKVQELGKYNEGDKVKVAFNLRSREFNGRWYTDIQIWRISPAGQAPQPQQGQQGPQSYGNPTGQPYGNPPVQAAPAPTVEDMPADNPDDDLPF